MSEMASRMGRSGDLLPGTAAVCESEVWRNVYGALSGREKTPAPFCFTRLSRNWKGDNFLGNYPASVIVKHRPIDSKAHALFAAELKAIPPEKRQCAI